MELHIVHPHEQRMVMQKDDDGYFGIEVNDIAPDARYFFIPDNEKDYPDPASHFQPQGVHGPSQVIDHAAFTWHDEPWKGIPFAQMILYELHTGVFTPEGSFEAVIARLDDLKAVGINALNLMPVSQFPGNRNWGYDGVYPYAVQNSYGGPEGLKKLVNVCHQKGMAVLLDVVYNHIGPEGNYLAAFGPYFTNTYCTPWGDAINFDGPWSDGVREYFLNNALHWFKHYHIDGLRVDAIHAVYDMGAVHFWELLSQKTAAMEKELNKPLYLVAESDLNSAKVVQPPALYGYGFHAQWLDDFHHALYTMVDPNGVQRYYDFGRMEQLAKAYTDGFVHSGEWVKFRKRTHGISSAGLPGDQFVVFNLNHDQVGNRVGGERLCMLVNTERVKLAAAATLLAPYVPMLFMGEEYADDTPFFYFVSHSDPRLIKAVQEGRKKEFKDYGFEESPPDAQDEATFNQSKLHWEKRHEPAHQPVLKWHTTLIQMRQTLPPLQHFDKQSVHARAFHEKGLALTRISATGKEVLLALFNFSEQPVTYTLPDSLPFAQKILDSTEPQWATGHHPGTDIHPLQVQASQSISIAPVGVVVYYAK